MIWLERRLRASWALSIGGIEPYTSFAMRKRVLVNSAIILYFRLVSRVSSKQQSPDNVR